MLYIKSSTGDYWDGKKFTNNYKKSRVFGAIMGCANDINRAQKLDSSAKIYPLSPEHFTEFNQQA